MELGRSSDEEAIGMDWRVVHWRGVAGPAGLTGDVEDRLRRVSGDPQFSEECRLNGFSLEWRFGDAFTDHMREDGEQFGRIITRLEGRR